MMDQKTTDKKDNEMTETERNMMIEMQPVFASFKGEWQAKDEILRKADNKIGLVVSVHEKALTIQFPDVSSPIAIDIRVIESGGFAWLPKSIDSETPERGLQGMIKNFEFLSDNSSHWVCSFWTEISPTAEEKWSEGATPTEALLRALRVQKEKG